MNVINTRILAYFMLNAEKIIISHNYISKYI